MSGESWTCKVCGQYNSAMRSLTGEIWCCNESCNFVHRRYLWQLIRNLEFNSIDIDKLHNNVLDAIVQEAPSLHMVGFRHNLTKRIMLKAIDVLTERHLLSHD